MTAAVMVDADAAAAERFAGRFDIVGDCWEWRGTTVRGGYGCIQGAPGRKALVHRVALEMKLGRPLTAQALHDCDNPPCFRPSHLHEGTVQDNMRERSQRGRTATGVRHSKAKLTPELVTALRADRAGGMTYRQLGAKYGINRDSARKAATGVTWRPEAMAS